MGGRSNIIPTEDKKCNDHRQEKSNPKTHAYATQQATCSLATNTENHNKPAEGFVVIEEEQLPVRNGPSYRCLLPASAVWARLPPDTMALITSPMLRNRSSHEKWLPVCSLRKRAEKRPERILDAEVHVSTRARLHPGYLNWPPSDLKYACN